MTEKTKKICLTTQHDIAKVVVRALAGDERAMSMRKRLAAAYAAIKSPTAEQRAMGKFAAVPLSRHRKNAELAAREAAEDAEPVE